MSHNRQPFNYAPAGSVRARLLLQIALGLAALVAFVMCPCANRQQAQANQVDIQVPLSSGTRIALIPNIEISSNGSVRDDAFTTYVTDNQQAYDNMLRGATIVGVVEQATPGTGSPPNIQSFFQDLKGQWIGTVEQYTNQKKADTKYFHATIKQMTPDTYAASFEYYRLDRRTGSPVQIGVTDMTNIINADGTATDTIQGNGDVFIDPKTSRHEEHQLSEVLRMSPSGSLEGKGRGKIKVNGMPLGAGRNGKVSDYTSVWVLKKDALTISERLKVTFRVLIFAKHYDIVYNFQAQRGGDINLMMKKAGTTAVRSPYLRPSKAECPKVYTIREICSVQ